MTDCEIGPESIETLARWLHELGEILWYADHPELASWVITHAQWVTQAISKVLSSDEVANRKGILTHAHLRQCWSKIDSAMHGHLLTLMEHFDLSYKIPDHRDASLVVELLPFEPPAYEEEWAKGANSREIALHLHLKTSLPPGIPTWFIARMHRFSIGKHWRYGALLMDGEHRGLIEVNRERRTVQLTVRGPNPWPFFAQLRDGLDRTLARYPGLELDRLIPCTTKSCDNFFNLDDVEQAEKDQDVLRCHRCLQDISVSELLYGRPTRSVRKLAEANPGEVEPSALKELVYGQRAMMRQMHEMKEQIREEGEATRASLQTQLQEMASLLQRQFQRVFLATQKIADERVPTVFSLKPTCPSWLDKLAGQEVTLQLYCEYPGHWHPTREGGCYTLNLEPHWLQAMAPYLKYLTSVMKVVMPALAPALKIIDSDTHAVIDQDLKLMEGLCKGLDHMSSEFKEDRPDMEQEETRKAEGVSLRQLRVLLDELDPNQTWGNLNYKFTPEGEVLWLCPYHYDSYDPIKIQGRPGYPGHPTKKDGR